MMHCYLFGYMTYLNAELRSRVSKGVVVMVGVLSFPGGVLSVDCYWKLTIVK